MTRMDEITEGIRKVGVIGMGTMGCLLYTSPSPRDS